MTTTEDESKYVIEYGKLGLLAVVILGGFTLVICAMFVFESGDDRFGPILALGSAQIAGAVGYLTGNGILASRGKASIPAIAATPARVAATALETGELANVPTGELIERKAAMRQQDQNSAVLHGLAAITAELERRTA